MFPHAWLTFRADFPDDPEPEESRFRHLRWYVERGWTGKGDEPWVPEPP